VTSTSRTRVEAGTSPGDHVCSEPQQASCLQSTGKANAQPRRRKSDSARDETEIACTRIVGSSGLERNCLRSELDPQVPLEDVLGPQICGGPGEHDLTTVHHVRVVGELKGPGDVLLDEE
jgi:hypothetical protein